MTAYLAAGAIGLAAGWLSGFFGVGGGVVFIPALTLVLGLSQLHAQATSLAAMIPVIAVGAWRQHGYGNVRWGTALAIGAVSFVGVAGGARLAESLPEHVLRRLFGAFLLVVAVQLLWTLRDRRPKER